MACSRMPTWSNKASAAVMCAAAFTWLQDVIARNTDYWRAILGGTIIALVLLFPQGLAGFFGQLMARLQGRRNPSGGVA